MRHRKNKEINCLVYITFHDHKFFLDSLHGKHGKEFEDAYMHEAAIDLRTGEQVYPQEEDPGEWKHMLPYHVRNCDLTADAFIDDLWEAMESEYGEKETLAFLRDLANFAHEVMSGKHHILLGEGRISEWGEYLAFNADGCSSFNGDTTEYDSWVEFLGIADISKGTHMTFEEYKKKELEKASQWILPK